MSNSHLKNNIDPQVKLYEGSLLPSRVYKPQSDSISSESRRILHLSKQKEHRNALFNKKRSLEWAHIDELNSDTIQETEISELASKHIDLTKNSLHQDLSPENTHNLSKKKKVKSQYNIFSNQLIIYDWLIDPPLDLYTNWFFCIRPEGTRCMITIIDDYAIVRDKYGIKFASFYLNLQSTGITILEAIYNSDLKTYFLIDVLIWNDCELANSTAECRFFFLNSRISESDCINIREDNIIYPSIKLINYDECNKISLLESYYSIIEYPKDSILFVHKEAHYLPGYNPLWLCWRDSNLSKYNVDSNPNFLSTSEQIVCLEINENGELRTADNIIVGKLDVKQLNFKKRGKPNLIKAKISGIDFDNMKLLDLKIIGKPLKERIYPEPYNRILMQHIQRMPEPIIDFLSIINNLT